MGIFGDKTKQVIRGIRSPFMNLAHRIIPTAGGAWDSAPTSLEMLTDEKMFTECVAGTDNDAAEVYIEVDLGRECEVYVIEIDTMLAHGFKQAAGGAAVDFTLKTLDAAATATTRDTQSVASDNAFYAITLAYNGDGIPVQKIRLCVTADAVQICTMQPGEIRVYGS